MIYYTNSFGPDIAALKAAFKKCGEIIQECKHTEMALLVPQKSNLDGIIRDLLGDDVTRILHKSNMCDLDGLSLRLFTKRNMPNFFDGPIVAAYVADREIMDLIKLCPKSSIIYVPWTEGELQAVKNSQQAKDLQIITEP